MRIQSVFRLVVGVGLGACSGSPPEVATPPRASASQMASSSATVGKALEPEAVCLPDPRKPKALPNRSKGVALLAQGKHKDALQAFELSLEESPSDVGTFTMHAIATAENANARADVAKAFARIKPLKVEPAAPPHKLFIKADKAAAITVRRVKEEPHNGDWLAWLKQTGVKSPITVVDGEFDLSPFFADAFGELSQFASYHQPPLHIVRYGPALLVIGGEGLGVRAVDLEKQRLEAFRASVAGKGAEPDSIFTEVRFAEVVGSTLLLELAHDGDGANVKSDGLLVAYDLELEKLRWVSDARIGNAHAAYLTGTHVVTTFSDSPTASTLHVVDLATGDVALSEPIAFHADYVVGKGKMFHVWGAERAITFELSSGPERPANKLGKMMPVEVKQAPTASAAGACFLENAVVALDHRDAKGALAVASQLPESGAAAKALTAASEFLSARANGKAALDFSEHRPVLVGYVDGPLIRTGGARPAVVSKRALPAKDPVVQLPKAPFPEGPRALYASKRYDIYPPRYGVGSIHGAFAAGDELALLYGNRYIVMILKDEVKRVFDLAPLLGAAGNGARTVTTFSTVLEGTFYAVVSATAGYGPGGGAAYVVAVDLASGKVLWRTPTGVVTSPFNIFGDALVTAITKNGKSSLSLFRLADGQVLQSTPLKEVTTSVGWDSRGVLFTATSTNKRQFFQVK